MVIDTSALMALLLREPGHEQVLQAAVSASVTLLSAGSFVELQVVTSRHAGPEGRRDAIALVERLGLQVRPVTVAQARVAGDAYERYGPTSSTRARLNLGDCYAYALAKELDEPLLYVGRDFAHTDLRAALPS